MTLETPSPTGPIVDLNRSPHARLRPLPLGAVQLNDMFWQPRRQANRAHTLASQFAHLEETGRLANFRRAAGRETGEFEGMFFNDSDVYKWLEAAASTLSDLSEGSTGESDQAALRAMIATATQAIAGAQQSDGYLDTYYSLHPETDRWEELRDKHQLYCMGHFIQAAIAHFRATGERELLEVARRVADCIDREFGPDKRQQTDGHEEIEMALVELYRATGEARYLKLAQFFVDVRGQGTIGGSEYHQDHVPFRQLRRVTGHAVRALYYACGATDLYLETGESALWHALEGQWANFTGYQMYLTGGGGSRWDGEAFGRDFELPNERAYTETCASIAVVMWAWRMGQQAGEARFFDVLERTLYNGVLSGLSLDGDEYFYQNPLSDDGTHRRQKWFGCACCPPNIARLLAQLPGYLYSVSEEGIWAHLFAQSRADIALPDGRRLTLRQTTRFPWEGEVEFAIDAAPPGEVSLFLRVPEWAQGATLEVHGARSMVEPGTYVEVRRVWQEGDTLTLRLPMEVQYLRSHPYVLENAGRIAVQRGPLVYCAEAIDHPGCDLRDLALTEAPLRASFETDLLGGVVALEGQGAVSAPLLAWHHRLYAPAAISNDAELVRVPLSPSTPLKLIPYYAWANRALGRMQVWLKALEA